MRARLSARGRTSSFSGDSSSVVFAIDCWCGLSSLIYGRELHWIIGWLVSEGRLQITDDVVEMSESESGLEIDEDADVPGLGLPTLHIAADKPKPLRALLTIRSTDNRREMYDKRHRHRFLGGHGRLLFVLFVVSIALFFLHRWTRKPTVQVTPILPVFEEEKKLKAPLQEMKKQPEEVIPKVLVEVHMESRCPDTTNFFHDVLWPVWTSPLRRMLDLRIYPFGKATCRESGGDYKCDCQHREQECLLNQLMNCIIRDFPDPQKHLPIIKCLQGHTLDSKGASCLKDAGLESESLISCAKGPDGRKLHFQTGQLTMALKPTMFFVPWIIINGQRSSKAFNELKSEICNALGDQKPPECKRSGNVEP